VLICALIITFISQNVMKITSQFRITPLKITKLVNFDTKYVLTYNFSPSGNTFLKIEKNSFPVKSLKKISIAK
jgi:hypothetical protein